MPRYEFQEGGSSKFWEITLEGTSYTTRYGRIGSEGQSTTKSFDTADAARTEHDKLVAEKLKKGYKLVEGGGAGPATAAPAAGADRKTVMSKLSKLTEDLTSEIVGSEGDDELLPLEWPGPGEFTLTSFLQQAGFIKPLTKEEFIATLRQELEDAQSSPEEVRVPLDAWTQAFSVLLAHCPEFKFLELRIFNSDQHDEWDDMVQILVAQEQGGQWLALGPKFDKPTSRSAYGEEAPRHAPPTADRPWMQPFTALSVTMKYCQESGPSANRPGRSASSAKPGDAALMYVEGPTAEAAVDRLLHECRLLKSYPFRGFFRPDEDDDDDDVSAATKKLDKLLLSKLTDVRLYVLGNSANYYHFVAGACADGSRAGVMMVAGWT
jgi:predicted DNA-binding WGR domain protein